MGSKRKNCKRFGQGTGRHTVKRQTRFFSEKSGRKKEEYTSTLNSENSLKLTIKKKRVTKKDVKKTYEIYKENGKFYKRKILKKLEDKNEYKLFNISLLKKFIEDVSLHASLCHKAVCLATDGLSPVKLMSQISNFGLAGVYSAKCFGCKKSFILNSSEKLECGNFDSNVRAVWGTLVTGNGLSHLNELLAVLDTPGISYNTFSKIELKINKWWED
jgi:hypothetical protein